MYAWAVMENQRVGSRWPLAGADQWPRVDRGRPAQRREWEFVGANGLPAVRELALALGLARIDDPALWEPA